MISRSKVYAALDEERDYQEQRAANAGVPEGGVRIHSLEQWSIYMADYMREMNTDLARVWTPDSRPSDKAIHCLRKITAMGVAAMEQDLTLTRAEEEAAKQRTPLNGA